MRALDKLGIGRLFVVIQVSFLDIPSYNKMAMSPLRPLPQFHIIISTSKNAYYCHTPQPNPYPSPLHSYHQRLKLAHPNIKSTDLSICETLLYVC